MVDFSNCVDRIFEIIKESKDRNYPEFVLRHDLNTYLQQLYKSSPDEINEAYEDGKRCAEEDFYDDGREEGYSEGFEDGKAYVIEKVKAYINKVEEDMDSFIEELE